MPRFIESGLKFPLEGKHQPRQFEFTPLNFHQDEIQNSIKVTLI